MKKRGIVRGRRGSWEVGESEEEGESEEMVRRTIMIMKIKTRRGKMG